MMSTTSGSTVATLRKNAIPLKNKEQVAAMREACKRAAEVLQTMAEHVQPGISTYDLDRIGKDAMEKLGVQSACYGYEGSHGPFPAYTCISLNEEVVHGIGVLEREIQSGDIVSLDVVTRYEGFIGDNARTVIVGDVDPSIQDMVKTTEEALYKGIEQAVSGNRVGDISNAVQKYVERKGYSVIREFVGHGVGQSMHEPPQIPNFGRRKTGDRIKPGMTFAIEPMVNMGRKEVTVMDDGWTVTTKDGLPAAHFEHTVLVTSDGVEILTSTE